MEYRKLIILLLFTYKVSADLDIRCTTAYCTEYIDKVGCRELTTGCQVLNSTNHGTFLLHPDVCNCFDYCLTNLIEGEGCIKGLPGQIPPSEICGPGLACRGNADEEATCQKMITACTSAQGEYDTKINGGAVGSSEVRPQCDDDGLYESAHCIPGSICYCLDPTGNRIFGEIPYLSPWNKQEMSCECSLNAWQAQNTLDPTYEIPVARCLSNGQFDPVQCLMAPDTTCLCIDKNTGAPISNIEPVNVTDLAEDTLPCFDTTIHKTGTFNTSCEEAYDTLVASGITDEKLLPLCQLDGKYARIQYSKSKKICTDPDGVQIDNYEAEMNGIEATIMDCNCARTRWILSEAKVTELPSCCAYGNFAAWQCRRNECYCVDSNGDQITREVDIDHLTELSCYVDTNGDACHVS